MILRYICLECCFVSQVAGCVGAITCCKGSWITNKPQFHTKLVPDPKLDLHPAPAPAPAAPAHPGPASAPPRLTSC
jgi:hypothetical protein